MVPVQIYSGREVLSIGNLGEKKLREYGSVEVLCPCADAEALAQASEALAQAGGNT